MDTAMREQPDIITHADSLIFPPGLWILDPILLGEEDSSLVIQRANTNGEIRATIRVEAIPHHIDEDEKTKIAALLEAALRRDAHFPGTDVRWFSQGAYLRISLAFKSPHYSTPRTYCGKPQLRMWEAYDRGKALIRLITSAMANVGNHTPAEDFATEYSTARLQYAAES